MNDRGYDRSGDLDDPTSDWCVEIMLCCGRHPWRCACWERKAEWTALADMGYTVEVDMGELPIARQ